MNICSGTPVSSAPVSPTASASLLHTPTSTASLTTGLTSSGGPLGNSWRSGLSRCLLANLEDIETTTLCRCLYSLVVQIAPPASTSTVSPKLPASLRLILDQVSHTLPSARLDAGSALLMISVFSTPAVDDVSCAAKMAKKMCEAPDLNSGRLEEIATTTCSHWKFSYAARRRILPLICNRVESSEFSSPRLVALLAATCAPPHTAMPGGRQHPSGDDLQGLVQSASLLRLCAGHAADALASVGAAGVPGGTAWVVKDVIDVVLM